MYKTLFLTIIVLWSTTLFAYVDTDMDGVEDSLDKCPDTPLTDLVDLDGCTIKTIKLSKNTQKTHFDIIAGVSYAGSNYASSNKTDTYTTSIQADWYYGDFSLQVSTSYYKTSGKNDSDKGMNDSYIGAAYTWKPTKALYLRFGVGALLPTYDTTLNNNKTDYTGSLSLSYTVKKVNIYAGYVYTQINDTDVISNGVRYDYRNTVGYNAGLGYYFTNALYMSLGYSRSNSIYKTIGTESIEDIESASLYGYYALSKYYFAILSYAYGLSDSASDHAVSLKVGYYF